MDSGGTTQVQGVRNGAPRCARGLYRRRNGAGPGPGPKLPPRRRDAAPSSWGLAPRRGLRLPAGAVFSPPRFAAWRSVSTSWGRSVAKLIQVQSRGCSRQRATTGTVWGTLVCPWGTALPVAGCPQLERGSPGRNQVMRYSTREYQADQPSQTPRCHSLPRPPSEGGEGRN
jgi:hypothetical protein